MPRHSWQHLFTEELAPDADWHVTTSPADDEDAAFWANFSKALDPRFECPQARADVVIERLPGNQGAILSDEKSGLYIQIAPEDLFLWERMDGSRSQIDLVVDYVMEYKALAPTRIAALVDSLRWQGLLVEPADELYLRLRMQLAQMTPMGRVNKFTQTFLKREFAISGVDRLIGAVFRTVGWVFYKLPVQVVLWIAAVGGLGAFLWLLTRREFSVLGEGTLVQGATTLAIFQFVSIFLHEWAHALTVKAYGRKVRRAGFFLLFGLPGVFVDTTDIWPSGKRAQLAVTWAGPFLNLILGGIAALWIIANPTAEGTAVAFQFAVSQYSLVLLNLTPFIRLDGYYLLADWLGVPNLNQRSSGFLRNGLPAKLRQAWQDGHLLPKLTREETILVVFGGLSALWIANLLGLAVLTAPVRMMNVLTSALSGNLAGASPVTLVFTLVGMLFTLLLLIRAVGWVRQWVRRTAAAFQTAPIWQMGTLFAVLALLIASVPDLLIWRDISEQTALIYTTFLSLSASGVALLSATQLTKALRGSRLRLVAVGMQITCLALTIVDLIGASRLLPVSPNVSDQILKLITVLTLTPGGVAALLSFPRTTYLLQSPLKWSLFLSVLGGLALIADMFVQVSGIAMFLSVAGHTLIASSLIFHNGLLRRPPVLPRITLELKEAEPADVLAAAVRSIVKELVQAVGEIDGRPAMLRLAADFNAYAASADLPLWLTMDGSLGEQPADRITERTAHYKTIMDYLDTQIGQRLGSTFARHAYAQALIELPLLSRTVFNHWMPNSAGWSESTNLDDDRARVRLAGRRIAETLVISCARIYGWRLIDEVVGGFNRVAASANWPLYIRGNGRIADEMTGDLLTITQIYTDALQDLLGRIVHVAGISFVERGLIQVYDTLPWEVREVANHTLFTSLSWARSLLTKEEVNAEVAFLRTVPLLGSLSTHDLHQAADEMIVRHVKAGRILEPAGTYLDRLIVIRKGRVHAVEQQGTTRQVADRLSASSLIGMRTISENQALPYTYIAQTDVEVWQLEPEAVLPQMTVLRQLEQDTPDPAAGDLLSRIPLFAMLDARQRGLISRRLEQVALPAGCMILQEGQPAQGFYILQTGEVDVLVTGVDGTPRPLSRLGAGEFFGEMALMTGAPVSATIQARTPVTLLRLSPEDFNEMVMSNLGSSLEQLQSRRAKERLKVQQMIITQETPNG